MIRKTGVEVLKQFHRGRMKFPYPVECDKFMVHGLLVDKHRVRGLVSFADEYVNRHNHGGTFITDLSKSRLRELVQLADELPDNYKFNKYNDCQDLSRSRAKELLKEGVPSGYVIINISDRRARLYVLISNLDDLRNVYCLKLIKEDSRWLSK